LTKGEIEGFEVQTLGMNNLISFSEIWGKGRKLMQSGFLYLIIILKTNVELEILNLISCLSSSFWIL
jgi:hypothetical protein